MRGDCINLLSANDLDHLKNAMMRMEEIELVREMEDTKLIVKTMTGGKPRTVAMIVQIRVDTPRETRTKNCESVEDLREWLKIPTQSS